MSSTPTVQLDRGIPLSGFTTLQLGGPAALMLTPGSAEEMCAALAAVDAGNYPGPALLLGGGSNLVIADAGVPGTVVRVTHRGHSYRWVDERTVELTAEAGDDWDGLVAAAVDEGLGGLECLSGIPGLTGATPVQNVGAYGVEISQLLTSVDLYERATGRQRTVVAGELGLGYRTSALKGTDAAVVLRVRLLLRADGYSMPVRYGELAQTLGVEPGTRVPAGRAREAVLGLRRGKGMVLDREDRDTYSAGSFFTNPVLDGARAAQVLAAIRERVGPEVRIPHYPVVEDAEAAKLSAAWLIQRAGFHPGHAGPGGRVALSHKHTLALTNRGGASTEDLLALAREIRDGVRSVFGVQLRPEPVLVGCSL